MCGKKNFTLYGWRGSDGGEQQGESLKPMSSSFHFPAFVLSSDEQSSSTYTSRKTPPWNVTIACFENCVWTFFVFVNNVGKL